MEGCIREIATKDLDDCARLFVRVFMEEPWKEEWTLESAVGRLSEILNTPGAVGFASTSEKEIVGFVLGHCEQWLDGRHFHLEEMCVRTDMQRKGIGTSLLAHLEERLKEMGVNQIYLLTAKDGQAEAFYSKNGYRTSQRMIVMLCTI